MASEERNYNIPWEQICNEFISSPQKPTLKSLCEKYDLCYGTVTNHAQKHKWLLKRREYWEDVHSDALEKVKLEAIEKQASHLKSLIKALDNHMGSITMDDLKKDYNSYMNLLDKFSELLHDKKVTDQTVTIRWQTEEEADGETS